MRVRGLFLAVSAVVASVAMAADRPLPKPGLWEITVSSEGSPRPPRTSRMCVDAATLGLLEKAGGGVGQLMCSRNDVRVVGKQVIADSVCKVESSTATTHTVISFDGNTAMRTDIHSHYEPAFVGKTDTSSVQTSRWIGECGADMKPGDVLIQGGIKINVNQLTPARR